MRSSKIAAAPTLDRCNGGGSSRARLNGGASSLSTVLLRTESKVVIDARGFVTATQLRVDFGMQRFAAQSASRESEAEPVPGYPPKTGWKTPEPRSPAWVFWPPMDDAISPNATARVGGVSMRATVQHVALAFAAFAAASYLTGPSAASLGRRWFRCCRGFDSRRLRHSTATSRAPTENRVAITLSGGRNTRTSPSHGVCVGGATGER